MGTEKDTEHGLGSTQAWRELDAGSIASVDPTLLETMQWRCIGPHRGGRVVAVAGHPTQQMVFYHGACTGGVWKTEDGGTYWENVSDGFFKTSAVGAIAVAESDPNVIYVGMGESCIRGNVAQGDGVYKSTDGGKTWVNVGLESTRHISRIRIHPQNPDLVYVAALGNAFGDSEDRGVYRSADGGGAWERVLFRSKKAGACDLSMDPGNPRILYAAIWETRRNPWGLSSGGPDSSLYKSTDGGDTWTDITGNVGLPNGMKGRMGVAASPAKTGRVWTIVESKERGLYRSDDGGATWELLSDDAKLLQRPWYYSHVFADPQDPETVWVLNAKAWKSTDGGRTFAQVTTPHGDNHDIWIDPNNPQRMVEGNDGGACVSFNGGATWSTIYNQPTAQFYRMTTDDQFPYRVYATQQDNSAISVPSRSPKGAILLSDCYFVGSSESGQIVVHPDDPNIVFSGGIGSSPGGGDSLLRYDHRTGQTRIVSVWPEFVRGTGPKEHKYRFQWTYPIVFSPHDSNTMYVAANVVFRSQNEGASWEVISPDLTRNDVTKMEASGGPITLDTTFVEHYGTIFAFAESPHQRGVFWVGTDDGLVHISHDGGKTWDDITPLDIPEWTTISIIELSHHDPATAYLAAHRYRLADEHPYLYKTNDYGETWSKITDGIPDYDFTRVIREDPQKRGLLYAGTERGTYVSFNDGASWQSLQRNLPAVAVHDLVVKDNELAAATHGRSFWILDDLTLLRQIGDEVAKCPAHLFGPASTYRIAALMEAGLQKGPGKGYMLRLGAKATWYETKTPSGEAVRTFLDAGTNPPDGVVVSYYLGAKPEGEAALSFLDSSGQSIRSFSSSPSEESALTKAPREPAVSTEAGMNRFVWDMRYPEAHRVQGQGATELGLPGPLATPGSYQVRLTVGGATQTRSFQLVKDPRVAATQEDFESQFALLVRIRDRVSETHDAVNRLRSVRRQVEEWTERVEGAGAWEAVSEAADGLKDRLSAVEEELIQTRNDGELDTLAHPGKLNAKLVELASVVGGSDHAPTQQSYDVFEYLSARTDAQLKTLKQIIDTDIAAFAALVKELKVPAIVPKPEP